MSADLALPPLPPPTWRQVSDKSLLPDGVTYGARWIDLKALWRVVHDQAVLWCQLRAYRAVYAQYMAEAPIPTGSMGEVTGFDRGYAVGMKHALDLLREEFAIPIPEVALPPGMAQ